MRYLNTQARKGGRGPIERALDISDVEAGLRSLQAHCLTNLAAGLDAMAGGDLTVAVAPVTSPIDRRPGDPAEAALVDLFNTMLTTARQALLNYERLRAELREALGDRSSLRDLQDKLTSLSDNCLVALGEGLAATTRGDLTRAALPVTTPLAAAGPGVPLGTLGETFNTMLGRAQGGLASYNEMRGGLAAMIGEIGRPPRRSRRTRRRCRRPPSRPGGRSRRSRRRRAASPRAPSARSGWWPRRAR